MTASFNASAWLATLQVGDEVYIPGEFTYQPGYLRVIEAVSTHEFRLPHGRRVNRHSGHLVGGQVSIRPVTQEVRDRIELHRLAAWARGVANTQTSLERLRAMYAAFISFD